MVPGGGAGWVGVAPADVGVAGRPLYLLDIYISDTGLILLGQLKFLDRPRYKLTAAVEVGVSVGGVAGGAGQCGRLAAAAGGPPCLPSRPLEGAGPADGGTSM